MKKYPIDVSDIESWYRLVHFLINKDPRIAYPDKYDVAMDAIIFIAESKLTFINSSLLKKRLSEVIDRYLEKRRLDTRAVKDDDVYEEAPLFSDIDIESLPLSKKDRMFILSYLNNRGSKTHTSAERKRAQRIFDKLKASKK